MNLNELDLQELDRHWQTLGKDSDVFIEYKRRFIDMFFDDEFDRYNSIEQTSHRTEFLKATGKLLGKHLNRVEQKEFLNKMIDKNPQIYRCVVGPIWDVNTSKHGCKVSLVGSKLDFTRDYFSPNISRYGFDVSLVDSQLDFTRGYFSSNILKETKKAWFEACDSGNTRLIKEYLALNFWPDTPT